MIMFSLKKHLFPLLKIVNVHFAIKYPLIFLKDQKKVFKIMMLDFY